MLRRLRRHLLQPWQCETYGDIRVHWKDDLQGGGHTFGQRYVNYATRRKMPRQRRIFEWCSGPGFIGFSMLAKGLCDGLCLGDINPRAVEACRRTVRDNGLADRVVIYQSDNLSAIPESEQFDLVVANPPHFPDVHHGNVRAHDQDWRTHKDFFGNIGHHLDEDGVVLLQENGLGSSAET